MLGSTSDIVVELGPMLRTEEYFGSIHGFGVVSPSLFSSDVPPSIGNAATRSKNIAIKMTENFEKDFIVSMSLSCKFLLFDLLEFDLAGNGCRMF